MRGRAAFYDQPFLSYEGFCEINCAVFGQNKYTNIRRFSTIFRHKTRIFSLQKSTKNTVLSNMDTQHKTKAKNRTFSLLIENTQI